MFLHSTLPLREGRNGIGASSAKTILGRGDTQRAELLPSAKNPSLRSAFSTLPQAEGRGSVGSRRYLALQPEDIADALGHRLEMLGRHRLVHLDGGIKGTGQRRILHH